jgi:mono/diheme cytochrome c family protein
MMRTVLLLFCTSVATFAADQATLDKGRQEEQRSCLPCHSLRLVHSNRLSRAAWTRELDKMTGWGTKIGDREALLQYLVANYGDDRPSVAPEMSSDGRQK